MSWHYKNGNDNNGNRQKWLVICLAAIIAVSTGGLYYYGNATSNQPPKNSEVSVTPPEPKKPELTQPLPWPIYGQSAYGTLGYGVLAVSNSEAKPVPIASLAKTITALAVLKKKPLRPGELGPSIPLTAADVALYNNYVNKSGTVAKVYDGQQLSQYHAVQAMILASANNVADSMAIWAFGSIEAYTEYANSMLKDMGLSDTTVADASGYSPLTVSTAEDMTKLAIAYLKKPVLKEITMQTEAVIPMTGVVKSRNSIFNTAEEFGVKTGNTEQAGRCFIATTIKNGSPYSVAVVLGSSSVEAVTQDTHTILKSGNLAVEQDIDKSKQ